MFTTGRGLHLVVGAANTPRRSTLLPLPEGANRLGFSPGGSFAWAMNTSGRISGWRCDEVLDGFHLPGWDVFIHALLCLEEGRWLGLIAPMRLPIAADEEPKWEQKLVCGDRFGREIWSVELKARLPNVQPNLDLFLTTDARNVAVVGNGDVRWFDVATGTEKAGAEQGHPPLPEVRVPAFPTPEPSLNALSVPARLVARLSERTVRIWSFDEKPIVDDDRLTLPGECSRLAFSANGRLLAAGTHDGQVVVWRTDDWSRVLTSSAHSDSVTALAFWPGGQQLLTAGGEGKVILWDLREGIERFQWHVEERPSALAVSRDGATIAVALAYSTRQFLRC
jgi:WD40 repeat protein